MPQSPSREESPASRPASAKLATSLFTASFGSRPGVVTSAPGSIKLIGEHTDYNGGPALSIAVERRAAVAAGLASRWSYITMTYGGVHQLELGLPLGDDWSDCLGGVVQELRALGAAPPGANIAISSAIPVYSGLAATEALAVALAKALSLLAWRRLTPAELLEVGGRAADQVNGMPAGRTNSSIATHAQRGTALLLEGVTGGIRSVRFPSRAWVLETGLCQELSEAWLSARRRECDQALPFCREWRPGLAHLAQLSPADLEELQWHLPSPLVPGVRHVVTETARTRSATGALARGDFPRLGRLLVEGHESLREDYQSTCEEADFLVSSAVARGAYGARLTGPGRGGAVIMLAPPESEARILAQVSQDFQDRFGRVLQVWSTRAAPGVRREAVQP
jgi:galactokinase